MELITREPIFGDPMPGGNGYTVVNGYGRLSSRLKGTGIRAQVRKGIKLAEIVPDAVGQARRARAADVMHYQWLGMEELTWATLPRKRPRVFTAHDIVPREPRRGQVAAFRRLMRRMDAIIVHSEHGATRLRNEMGVEGRVEVIPIGALSHLTAGPAQLPPELDDPGVPVVLFFGFVSAYKGIDVLLEAFAALDSPAELWIVGVPRVPLDDMVRSAGPTRGTIKVVPRYVTAAELAGVFGRADVVALPYREIDQSGVLCTALAFGRAIVASSVGGFSEVAERHGALEAVPPGDPGALAAALDRLLAAPATRDELARAAARAASGPYSWEDIGRRTVELYRSLL